MTIVNPNFAQPNKQNVIWLQQQYVVITDQNLRIAGMSIWFIEWVSWEV